MKKIISLFLVAVMALSIVALAGCGDKKEESAGAGRGRSDPKKYLSWQHQRKQSGCY